MSDTLQPDMARVVHRAATNTATLIADMAAQLAMTQEMADLRQARIAELEQQATERDAELARLRQTLEALEHPDGAAASKA